ncbi:hypothetical protein ACFP51_14955 [Streptomyces pratens]|uniref:Uncharacterized protein n=1 Tax=Streptomyces pratens TaxID=887456 RepID=A0ABW1M6M2_9ACTN
MEMATDPTDVPRLDRTKIFTEVRPITQPRLDVPALADTVQRTDTVSGMLRALLDDTRGDEREAVRVMRRLGTRLLAEPPQGELTPFTAWQYLVNLARCTEAFLDVEQRTR